MANIQIYKVDQMVGEVTLMDTTGIGRNPTNQVSLLHAKVSGDHARIVNQNGAYWLEDLNSTNGTFINGKRVTKSYRLHHHDQIAIGEHTLRFVSIGSEEKAAALEEGHSTNADGTMMINPGQLKDMLESHKMNQAERRGKVIGWLEMVGNSLPLSRSEVIIGKAENADIQVTGFLVPRISASVVHNRDGYYIQPRKRGKVSINGGAVYQSTKLRDGDQIQVRALKMKFLMKSA